MGFKESVKNLIPKKLFKATVPELKQFIGKTVIINGEKIKIKSICGNIGMMLGQKPEDAKPTFYEINGEHLMNMLRFHAQMCGDTSITEEQFEAFENIVFEAEKIIPKEKTLKDKLDEHTAKSSN